MEVSDQIIKVLDEISKKFGLAVDWTQQNIAPYIQDLGQRIIRYEIYTSIAWMIAFLLLIIVAIFLIKFLYKYDEDLFFMSLVFGIPLILFSIIAIGVQTFDIIKAVTLPETIWLDYLKQYLPK